MVPLLRIQACVIAAQWSWRNPAVLPGRGAASTAGFTTYIACSHSLARRLVMCEHEPTLVAYV